MNFGYYNYINFEYNTLRYLFIFLVNFVAEITILNIIFLFIVLILQFLVIICCGIPIYEETIKKRLSR